MPEKKDITMLSAEMIAAFLGDHPWRDRLAVFDTLGSTNDLAKQLASAGAPEGTAVVAEAQTKGRGRMGRSFSSPAGQGIYLSVILRPEVKPTELMHLTAAAAETIAEAVQAQTGLICGVKWVNDLICGGKKLAGILTELSVAPESGLTNYIVVGVGLNCCQRLEDFPPELQALATSVAVQSGSLPDRNALCAAMIAALSRLSGTLLSEKRAWMERYRARCVTLGKQVQVLHPGGTREAIALDVDENAALEVEYPDGTRAFVSSGEVSVRGLYGYIS